MRRRGCPGGDCCGSGPAGCWPCSPCQIPEENLSLSVNGGAPTTLVYSAPSNSWSDGTYTLTCTPCTSYGMVFQQGSTVWGNGFTTCHPVSYTFTDGSGNSAVVTDPSGTATCASSYAPCNACQSVIVGSFTITDATGSHTAAYNSTLGAWVTPPLCSPSVTPLARCPLGTALCDTSTHGGGALYAYSISCSGSGHLTVLRAWYEFTCISPGWQYAPCSCNTGAGAQKTATSGSQPIDCTAPSWSGTLTKLSGNLADPVGGSVSISGSPFGPPTCCQTFAIRGCNTALLHGVTVNVYDSAGGTLYASGVTASSGANPGKVTLYWSGHSCSVYVTVVDPQSRFANYGSSLSLTFGSTTTITMTLASGFTCITSGGCPYPLPSTLHCTFANAGAQVFSFSAGNWTASFTYLGVAYVLNLATNGTMTATANGVGFTCSFTIAACPVTGPFSGTITPSGGGAPLGNGTITE